LRTLFSLANEKKRFIYEVQPSKFGSSLTAEELEYWVAFHTIRQSEIFELPQDIYDMDDVIELINEKNKKMKRDLRNPNSKGRAIV
jgi:hypothetical protein